MVLMIALVKQKKKISINLRKANTKCRLSLHYNGDESYLYVNKTDICKFKAKDSITCYNFCLGSVSKGFTKDEQNEIFLNSTVYDFPANHSSIKKDDIFNIHQYLMVFKKEFTGLLTSIVNSSNHTKFVSLGNQKCTIKSTLINFCSNEYT